MALSEVAAEFCRRVGVPVEVAERAALDSMLLPALVDYALGPGPPSLTVDAASEAAGTDAAALRRWWRAMGFADPPNGELIATELDVRWASAAHVSVVSPTVSGFSHPSNSSRSPLLR